MHEAKCSGCGAAIVWIETRMGKSMPCDPELVHVTLDCPKGQADTTIVTDRGHTLRGKRVLDAFGSQANLIVGRISHFASCGTASQFRRGG